MDHDELRVVCDNYEGLWEFLRDDIDKNQPHTCVVHECVNSVAPWAIISVYRDERMLNVIPLNMGRIPVGVSFCFQENTPLTQGVFSNMLKLAEHAVREKLT